MKARIAKKKQRSGSNLSVKPKDKNLSEAEQEFVFTVLELLHQEGIELTKNMAISCLMGAKLGRNFLQRQAQQRHAEQQRRAYRDSLYGKEKVDYVTNKLKEGLSLYNPSYQEEEVLPLALEEQQVPEDWQETHDTKTYLKGTLEKILGGCSKSFRQKVVAKYQAEVLPELLRQYEVEQYMEKACDELLALTNDKTVEQIRKMIAVLEKAA